MIYPKTTSFDVCSYEKGNLSCDKNDTNPVSESTGVVHFIYKLPQLVAVEFFIRNG